MNSTFVGPALPSAPDLAGLQPLETIKSRWPMIFGAVVSVGMVVGLGYQLLGSGLAGLERSVPGSPWFYLFFTLLYFSPPTADYIIFRRLWAIPFEGWVALLKKRVANDVVLGYSGDALFYTWARSRAKMVAARSG